MTKKRWLKTRRSEDDYEESPPVWLGNRSNGEFFHEQTPKEKRMRALIMERAGEQARKLGIERREFLASSMGMMTTLAVFNQLGACGDDGVGDVDMSPHAGTTKDGSPLSNPYVVPTEATCEETGHLEGDEFIMDVQTHSFDDGEWREKNLVYKNFLEGFASCGEGLDCFDAEHYGRLMFAESDTTISVITSWPSPTCSEDRQIACGLPLSNEGMRDLRDFINDRAMSQRCINQVQVMPNDRLPLQKDNMQQAVEEMGWRAGSWKAYPAWQSDTYKPDGKPAGYYMTDDIGLEFIEHGIKLGIPNFAIHKGLPMPSFDVPHNLPSDIGPVARMYPDANFVIYHSAISATCSSGCGVAKERGEFDMNDPELGGMGTLVKSLIDEGISTEEGVKQSHNVYAELGSAWSNVMNDAEAAQHFMGKLLKYLGEDNIVWGTDAILFGSPQGLIEAFRTFEISEEFQDKYDYPALTKSAKAKIFGLNAARIYRVDPQAKRCAADESTFAEMRQRLDTEWGDRRWAFQKPMGPRTRREFMALSQKRIAKNNPG